MDEKIQEEAQLSSKRGPPIDSLGFGAPRRNVLFLALFVCARAAGATLSLGAVWRFRFLRWRPQQWRRSPPEARRERRRRRRSPLTAGNLLKTRSWTSPPLRSFCRIVSRSLVRPACWGILLLLPGRRTRSALLRRMLFQRGELMSLCLPRSTGVSSFTYSVPLMSLEVGLLRCSLSHL